MSPLSIQFFKNSYTNPHYFSQLLSCLLNTKSMAEDYNRSRSYSYSDDRNHMDMIYNVRYDVAPNSISAYSNNPHDFRSYSYGAASSIPPPPLPLPPPPGQPRDWKLKKGKIASSSSKSWSFNDPEFQRKKRVASYKVYSVEGKVKGSFRRSFRWLKDKYTQVVYGWWWISPSFFFLMFVILSAIIIYDFSKVMP